MSNKTEKLKKTEIIKDKRIKKKNQLQSKLFLKEGSFKHLTTFLYFDILEVVSKYNKI